MTYRYDVALEYLWKTFVLLTLHQEEADDAVRGERREAAIKRAAATAGPKVAATKPEQHTRIEVEAAEALLMLKQAPFEEEAAAAETMSREGEPLVVVKIEEWVVKEEPVFT